MDMFCWELESLEGDTSEVARVDSSTNSRCFHHRQRLFCDDYYLNILVYCQEYLIYHDYWSNHLVPHLEQRHKVGHMNSHNQMNSCHYCYYVLHFWHSEGGRTVLFVSELVQCALRCTRKICLLFSYTVGSSITQWRWPLSR
jgi:hypothetical protein